MFDPPPSLIDAKLDVPRELNHIVGQLLSKSPDDRVPTPLALIHRLLSMQHALDSHRLPTTNQPVVDITNTNAGATYTDDTPTGEFTRNEIDEDNSPTLLHPTMQVTVMNLSSVTHLLLTLNYCKLIYVKIQVRLSCVLRAQNSWSEMENGDDGLTALQHRPQQ